MLEKIKAKLKDLSKEEMEELKTFLLSESSIGGELEESSTNSENKNLDTQSNENTPKEETAEENVPAVTPKDSKEESGAESIPVEEETSDERSIETESGQGLPLEDEDNAKDESFNTDEEQEQETQSEDDVDDLKIEKITPPTEDEDKLPSSEQITADDGEELPVDYGQIIDGLNAKVTALEAENASLKAKIDGAFGYSSKPSIPVKNNRLYDDCSDIVMHR